MLALPLVVFAAIAIAAAPAPFALQDAPDAPIDDGEDDPCDDLVSVRGEVTELLYKPYDDPEDDEDDGTLVLCAWHIDNLTADEELTIKEEGRPPWAGGPTALSIDP
jgi:hypothetical protein